jgi:hypothetical protein
MISGAADLHRLSPWGARFDVIQVAWAPFPMTSLDLQQLIDRDYFACGCTAARVSFVVTALGLLLFAGFSTQPILAWHAEIWTVMLSALVLIPLTTMLAAILQARVRLANALRRLRSIAGSG